MTEKTGYFVEDLSEGMDATHSRLIAHEDIVTFADLSGDDNPLHLDDDYARTTMFGGRIAHGLLSASLLSTVIGTKLPGPGAVYLSQSLKFRAPVRIGDTVLARATITAIDRAKRRVTLACRCSVGDTTILTGEALVMVPSRAGR